LRCLGGCREVGRNAFLIDGKEKILLDYGLKVETGEAPLPVEKADALLIAHPHLDHCGSAPALFRKKNTLPVYSTSVAFDLIHMLLLDSMKVARLKNRAAVFDKNELERMKENEFRLTYGQSFETKRSMIEILDAGHVPGSMMCIVETEGKRILYTSDFNLSPSRLLNGADINQIKDIDVAIMESTYSNRDHPERAQTERDFYKTVKDTIDNDGIALIPAFAVGRAAEVLMVLSAFKSKFPIYMDGMAKQATSITLRYPELLRNAGELEKAINGCSLISSDQEREKALKKPCAIITTGGCIDGGPAVYYLKRLWNREDCSLIFTGFQIPKTAGRYLLDTGRYVTEDVDLKMKMGIKHFDFSAHCGRSQLFEFVKKIRPKKVVCIHGENCERFATELNGRFEGIEAVAPHAGDTVEL